MSPLEDLQTNIEQYLMSDAALQYVTITRLRPRTAQAAAQIQTTIADALAGKTKRNGKGGVSAIVTMPEVDGAEGNLPGINGMLTVQVRVIENIMINMSAGGTGLSCEEVAILIAGRLQHRSFDGVHSLSARERLLTPEPTELTKGNVEYAVTMRVPFGAVSPALVATPVLTEGEGGLVMTCATEGAAIYFTLGDGGFPGAGNPDAVLYQAPVVLEPGVHHIRVAAHKAGLMASLEERGTLEVEAGPVVEE